MPLFTTKSLTTYIQWGVSRTQKGISMGSEEPIWKIHVRKGLGSVFPN